MAFGTAWDDSARARLARNLRAMRAEQGRSQEALGERSELHRTYVGSVERQERNVALDNVGPLAEALQVDICDLLAREPR